MFLNKKTALFIALAVFFAGLDRFLKMLALNFFEEAQHNLIGGIFKFSLAKNEYIAFSLPFGGPFLLYFTGFLIGLLIVYWLILNEKSEYGLAACLTFVIFGAISNMLDRIKFGYVIDYLDLKYFTIFNVADIMIVGGVFLLIIFLNKKNEKLS